MIISLESMIVIMLLFFVLGLFIVPYTEINKSIDYSIEEKHECDIKNLYEEIVSKDSC